MRALMRVVLTVYITSLLSCSWSSDSKTSAPPCSTASNVTDSQCQKQINQPTGTGATLKIKFGDSYFYNWNYASWNKIDKGNLGGGIIGFTIPVYSDYISYTTSQAIATVKDAFLQYANPSGYPQSAYSMVPYIELAPESGVTYLYEYKKFDSAGNIVFNTTGQAALTSDGRAMIPLINSSFNDGYHVFTTTVGTKFTHTLDIAAQSKTATSSDIARISFSTVYEIKNIDFQYVLSNEIKGFTQKNRWTYYRKPDGVTANDNLPLVSFVQLATTPEQAPVDLKVKFLEAPKIEIYEEPFFEFPFKVDTSGQLAPSRGATYYVKPMTLTSEKDFGLTIKIGGRTPTANASGKEFELLGFPGGEFWNISFALNMSTNAQYSTGTSTGGDPNSKGLLWPLRPICNEINQSSYNPTLEESAKRTAISQGGYIAICSRANTQKEIISSANRTLTHYDASRRLEVGYDTWFNDFSYAPYDLAKNEVGHLYGLRTVRISISGCLQLLVKDPSSLNATYAVKTKTSSNCVTGSQTGWVSFYAEKQVTVFDNASTNEYDYVPGLKTLLQSFNSTQPNSASYFWFNGEELNDSNYPNATIRHIY